MSNAWNGRAAEMVSNSRLSANGHGERNGGTLALCTDQGQALTVKWEKVLGLFHLEHSAPLAGEGLH